VHVVNAACCFKVGYLATAANHCTSIFNISIQAQLSPFVHIDIAF
jgi:hypothetical protein